MYTDLEKEAGKWLGEVVMYVLMFCLQTAVDSIEHIDTVVSLGLEDKFYGAYKEEISKPFRWVPTIRCMHCTYNGPIPRLHSFCMGTWNGNEAKSRASYK